MRLVSGAFCFLRVEGVCSENEIDLKVMLRLSKGKR